MEMPSFLGRVCSIALVDKSMEYVGSRYNNLKNSNQKICFLISGVEGSVLRVVQTAFQYSKRIVPYDRLDKLACASLDKAENYWNWDKKTPVKVSSETAVETLPEPNIVATIAWNAIDKMENVVDYVLPPATPESPCTKNEIGVLERLSSLGLHTKQRIVETGKRAAALKGEQLPDNLTVSHITNSFRHLLSNSYRRLQNKPEAEGTFRKPLRLVALTSVGVTLSVMGAAEATLPRVSETSANAFIKAKAAGHATSEMANDIVNKVYTNAQRNGMLVFSRSKRLENKVGLGTFPGKIPAYGTYETNSSQEFSRLENEKDVWSRNE